MTDKELEQLADELGDVQQAIAYLLFRRSRPTLTGQAEQPVLGDLARRLRAVSNRLKQSPAKLPEGEPHGQHIVVGPP